MGWSYGYDDNWKRDIGYGVPAYCDHPGCVAEIHRGLACVCGGEPYGGDRGCGLFFCSDHLYMHAKLGELCERCSSRKRKPFNPTPDHSTWVRHKLTHESWAEWRKAYPKEVAALREQLKKKGK